MADHREEAKWAPTASGNTISRARDAVVKRYRGDVAAYYREYALITRVSTSLEGSSGANVPLPRILIGSRPGELRTAYIAGISGGEAIELGHATSVLEALGGFLQRLHRLDPGLVKDAVPGDGAVIVHGDFAYYNCVMRANGRELAAVIDWEAAHLGDVLEDLAWCEFQFIHRFPRQAGAVAALYAGYGQNFDARLRRDAFDARLAALNELSRRTREPLGDVGLMRFSLLPESAAFIAALSRFLNSPSGVPYCDQSIHVWSGSDGRELWLSAAAINASVRAFGSVRLVGVFPGAHALTQTRTVFATPDIPSWGASDAEQALSMGREDQRT